MTFLFFLLASIMFISALLVVFLKSPVNNVIFLIVCFIAMAGHYILLNAQFLAVVHIIVYTGAIMVLFLFVIMLLNLNKAIIPQKSRITRILAVVTGGIFFLVPFEVSSVLFISAMVGAVMFGKKDHVSGE